MPKPRLHASHREHREQGESSLEKKSPKDPHRHHHQKKTDVKDKAAVLVHETSSRGQSLLGGAISGPTRSVHDCCGTYTVQYVSGGVRRQAELKVPVLQLMDVIAGEIRVMTSSQLPGEDSKAKQQNAAPVCLKHKVPAASDTKPIPVRVTRNHSPPFCKAGLACKRLQKKVAPKENRLQALQQQEIYEDVSDVPLEEYCDASGSADSTQANVSTGAAVNKPCQPPHKQHKGAPLEKGAAVNKPGQPPHKKHKGAPLEDYEDISDTPLDEYDPSDKPVQSASVADVTNGKVAKAHGKIVGSKPGDSTSKKLAPSSKVLVNKAEKKGPPEAQSSVRTSAAEVQPNEAKSKLTSKPSASSASGKDMVEKRAVKRPGMPCKDHDTKRVKIDADAAEDKTEPGAGTAQKSNSGSSLTKKASLAKPASKLSPCAKNITATCGLKETSTTKLKVGVTETVAKINTATSSVEKKNCLQALNKAEPDNLVKKPMSCGKSSSDVSTSNISRKVHVSSAPKTAKDVTETKVKHASEGAHGNSTPSVTKKVLPSKLEKKPASSMKGNSDIPACKSSCSSTPTKDSITAKIVKSVTGEKVSPSVTKKALPSKPVSSHKGSLDVAKSSSQSISTKAALSTPKPVNDKAKVKPVNDSAKLKVSSSTHVSTMAKEASSKLAKRPVSSANTTSEASAAASTKALKSAKETQSSDTAAKVDKKPQSDLKSEHIKHANDSGSFSNKGAVKNVNASGSKTKQCSRTVAPAKDTLERKPPTCSASSTEVKISRCKLFSKRKSPERSSSSQIQAAAGRLKSAPECDGNKQQGTPETLAAKQTEQVPKAVKTQPTESTESSLSVPDSAKTTSPSSTSKGLCESKIQNCHSSNILKVNAAEVTGEQSSLQHYTVYKASPKATEVLTEAVAPTKDHVSKGPTSDIADTVSETAPYGTDSTDKDKSYLQNSCVPAVQEVLAEALDQNATLVVASQDVEAHVAGCVEDLDIGSEVKCQDACPAKNESTIHQDDGHKLQQDPSDTAGQSQKFTVLTATPDGTFPGESTVNSTYHPFGQQDKNTSQVVHDVAGLLHEPGNTEEEQDSALARISTSPAPLQKGLFQAECCTLPSTKMDVDPPTKTEFNAGSLPEQSSVKHAQDGSSVSPPNKTGSDALVLRECDKARDVLLEGASPPSPAGDMPAGTTRDSEMPSSVMQKGLFQAECSTLPSTKMDVDPPASTEVSAGSFN
ncbi:muscle M-line assembly protein unc-89 isoform X2 [Dermacentor silvarum]|uniref:muscle M-line assembly protein unc-89 isoform X2 n=1 Tax=Dermacentor silvarum TaxID=543639 RepID=UPI002100FF2C|nr:muscle M-line assembly protein unc-89 isoform X2 [Dermacentor silvarum]